MVTLVKDKSIYDLISLKGKRALITGAASGIGKAVSYRLAEVGTDLYLVDINEKDLRILKDELYEKYKVDVEEFMVDLSKKKNIDELWKMIEGREPDILVNNAGIYLFKDFIEVDEIS